VAVDILTGAGQRNRGLIEEDGFFAVSVVTGLVRVGRIIDVLCDLDPAVPMM
jgi:hypothetical protein